VDQVYSYLGIGLYYGILAAGVVSYLVLLGYLLWNKQWLFVFLSIAFTAAFYPTGPFIVAGPLIAVIIGWQEAKKWNIKNLVRITSVLMVLCFIVLARDAYITFVTPKPKVDPAKLARERAQKALKGAMQKAK
jgi:hypothetical protein